MQKTFLTLFLGFLTLSSIAQTTAEVPYIEVTGTHEMEVTPNEIYIAIHIKEQTVDKEKLTIEVQEMQLKQALKQINIPISSLFLTNTMASYQRVNWKNKDVVTEKKYMLKVTDAVTTGKVFQELDKLHIREAYIDHVDHSDIADLRKDCRVKAIKAAKEKANYLLSAIGSQTGTPLIVREEFDDMHLNTRANARYRNQTSNGFSDFNASNSVEDIEFEKIKIKMMVYVKFKIQ
ncbi:MAG: hypothetical protein RL264_1038 [Bacteroidota bacterium]|jgi:uncharacterized protein YggE